MTLTKKQLQEENDALRELLRKKEELIASKSQSMLELMDEITHYRNFFVSYSVRVDADGRHQPYPKGKYGVDMSVRGDGKHAND